ncbi:Pupal cuticle protein 27 [Amphibalanus amphitrite]|uniref:Pupal cuticle protein 27 n=1 Tax=Amphibalanus amphitrite TaxID=1232801 RepID=A0A6A4UZU2_AMPAM|nr:larval cuticle protein 65Ag1-like [Amphibalanus amphitrite]KAF0288016.1 Pupal cuticle protein 27 [Amphibalanus amphitrite]
MKLFVACCLLAMASAAPQLIQNTSPINVGQPQVRILSERFENDDSGNYEFSYEQDNGQRMEEIGRFQPGPEPKTGSLSQQGSYEYVGDDGNTYQVSYVADVNGFQPQANHLPVAPQQIEAYAQLRADFPQLFWAEGLSAGRQVDEFGQPTFENRGDRITR